MRSVPLRLQSTKPREVAGRVIESNSRAWASPEVAGRVIESLPRAWASPVYRLSCPALLLLQGVGERTLWWAVTTVGKVPAVALIFLD